MNNLNEFKGKLASIKNDLVQRFHVKTIGLFGSVVRNDFNSESDVDIIVEFKQPIGIEFIDLAEFLEFKLNRTVDLVSRNGIKEKYLKAIEKEIVYV